ncbi:MAG TPA: lysophospholipid acyltransferase family protein, partial [Gemmatimonadaceae bacterium]|nr:lysophospholipid acyltransferase family protein [Gemmatimonadaceae bacterium]
MGAIVPLTTILGPLASVVAIPDSRNADRAIKLYAQGLLASAGVRVTATGGENIPPGPCVFIANHQSLFDPAVLAVVVGDKHIRYVAKAPLFKIPIFGQAIKAVGMVKVERTGTARDLDAMASVVKALRRGVSIAFFPEGTRTYDGVIKTFKKGAMVVAIQAQVPIVPVAIAGTKDILEKGSALIHAGKHAVVRIGEPIQTAGLAMDRRDELVATC